VDGAEALVHEGRDHLAAALAAAERALQLRRRVVDELPQDVEYRDALVTEAATCGRLLLREGRVDEALAATTQAWALLAVLEAEHPAGADNWWTRRRPALALAHGHALLRNGRGDEAAQVLPLALVHAQRLAQVGRPDAPALRALAHAALARARADFRDPRTALALAQRAWDEAEPPAAADARLRRIFLLARADAAQAAVPLAPPDQLPLWLRRQKEALDAAHALLPLAGEPARWRQALGSA
jgi:hypothetical protein